MQPLAFCEKRMKNFSMWLHATCGLSILVITITMSANLMKNYNWEMRWSETYHSAFGLSVMFATIFVTILGALAWATSLLNDKPAFRFLRKLNFKVLHKWIAYPLLIFA